MCRMKNGFGLIAVVLAGATLLQCARRAYQTTTSSGPAPTVLSTNVAFAVAPTPFTSDRVYFIGDSVTAGFGYCGPSEPTSFFAPLSSCKVNQPFSDLWAPKTNFTLGGCVPIKPLDNRCSNNNLNGEPWTAGPWKAGPTSPTTAYSFVIAQNQYPKDEAVIENWAITGSEPKHWDPVEVVRDGPKLGQLINKIKDSYVVMTLGANPLLSDYLKIKVIADGECADKTVKIGSIPPFALSDAEGLNFEPNGLGACFKRRWDELKQSQHLKNIYKKLIENRNHVLVLGYPVVCPWSFGNWQPYPNVAKPSLGKPCNKLDSTILGNTATKITQLDQARWLGEQANLLIKSLVDEIRAELNTGDIQFTQPVGDDWVHHQAWESKLKQDPDNPDSPMQETGDPWVFGNDTGIHPSWQGHRVLANTVIVATCEFFGRWCGGWGEKIRWSVSVDHCMNERAQRTTGAAGENACGDPLTVNPCLNDGWRGEERSDGSVFADQAACIKYADGGGLLIKRASAFQVCRAIIDSGACATCCFKNSACGTQPGSPLPNNACGNAAGHGCSDDQINEACLNSVNMAGCAAVCRP